MRLAFFFLLLSICLQSYAQTGIHYQAVVRDAGGTTLNNVPVTVNVTMEPAAGSAYTETINAMTNEYGILNIVIGQNGNMDLQDFNWEFGSVTMDLEIESGSKSILIEDQPVQYVPYAYYSRVAQAAIDDAVEDADADPGNELQSLSYDSVSQTLMLSDGGVVQLSFADEVEDTDADPTNELQTLSYDSVSRTIMLSDGGMVRLPAFGNSLWEQYSGGIYTEEATYIGQPTDTPHLLLNPAVIDFRTKVNDSSSQWTVGALQFMNGNFESTIGADLISLEGNVGPYNFENKIDTAGFTSTMEIFNERSTQFGGYFTAVKLPDSNNVFSQMNTSGLVIRSGGLSTNLNIQQLGIGGQWPVDYARLYGGGYGRLELYNGDDQKVVDLNSESGGGVLNLMNQGSDIEAHVTNSQLVFGEEGLGPYAFLSGNGYGQLSLFNDANWSAVELDAAAGPGEIRVNDGAGATNFTEIQFNRLRIHESGFYSELTTSQIELADAINGPRARLSILNNSGQLDLFNDASWKIVDIGSMKDAGAIYLYGPAGSTNIRFARTNLNENAGKIDVYEDNKLRFSASSSLAASGSGGSVTVYGDNNEPNAALTHLNGDATKGYITVFDENAAFQAGMYVDGNGDGRIFADVKNFKMAHPVKEGTSIYYASLEGPEVAAYDRGTARLKDGKVEVTFSEHFQIVANPETMTVMLTPNSSDTYGLAVVEKTASGFVVEELKKGMGNFSFDWEVKCKRRGYENWQVEQKDVQNQPLMQRQ